MSHGQSAAPEILLDRLRQPEQAERVGDGRAVSSEATGQLLLCPAKLREEPLIGLGRLDWVEVFAEEILDQPQLEGLGITGLSHDRGHAGQAGLLRRPPAPLSDQDLVLAAAGPHHERLEHPRRTDGGGKLLKRLAIEAPAGLLRIRDQTLDRELPEAGAVLAVSRWQEGA